VTPIAERRASLIPNLDLVAIRVGDVGAETAGTKSAPPEQLATSALYFLDSAVGASSRLMERIESLSGDPD